MCGHFPEGVETFEKTSIDGETRGEWYVRQMLGSANISGQQGDAPDVRQPVHQVEHHLFPDLPSNRYAEIAPRVKDIFDRYGLTYHSAPLYKQVASAWHKVIRLSLPNGWLAETTPKNAPAQIVKLVRMTTGGKKVAPRDGAGRLIAASLNRREKEALAPVARKLAAGSCKGRSQDGSGPLRFSAP